VQSLIQLRCSNLVFFKPCKRCLANRARWRASTMAGPALDSEMHSTTYATPEQCTAHADDRTCASEPLCLCVIATAAAATAHHIPSPQAWARGSVLRQLSEEWNFWPRRRERSAACAFSLGYGTERRDSS